MFRTFALFKLVNDIKNWKGSHKKHIVALSVGDIVKLYNALKRRSPLKKVEQLHRLEAVLIQIIAIHMQALAGPSLNYQVTSIDTKCLCVFI